jgi:hypothetical protein
MKTDILNDFLVYVIEEYKFLENTSAKDTIELFYKYNVFNYIIENYGALHTMSGRAIADDINYYMYKTVNIEKIKNHNIENHIEFFELLIREGENSLRNIKNSQYNKEYCTSIFLLYRDFLSYADSFMNLVKIRNLKGMLNQLRTIIEIKANIDYMLMENIEERATAHKVFAILLRIKMLQRYDKTTKLGGEFHKKRLKDKYFSQMDSLERDTNELVKNEEKIFQYSPYKEVYEKFTQKEKNWYSYNNGPKNMEDLFSKLNNPILYENHYRLLSGILHGSDICYYGLVPGAEGQAGLKDIHGEINVPFLKMGLRWTYSVIKDYCEKIFNNYQLPEILKKIFDN